jgi:DNA-binding NarL/FixJ family response regulator
MSTEMSKAPIQAPHAIARVLLVDDLAHCRAWMRKALTNAFPDAQIVEAASLAAGVVTLGDALSANQPFQLALIDLDLGDGSGLDLIRLLRQRLQRAHVVVSTMFDDDGHLFASLREGAEGYLLKDESIEQLTIMLGRILDGQPPLSASIARRLLQHFSAQARVSAPPSEAERVHLTERETEVLTLTAKGLTIPRVAELLTISKHTVAGYVKDIYRKLGVSSRAEAALEANRMGLA